MLDPIKDSYEDLEARIVERSKEICALYSALAPLKPSGSLSQMLEDVMERLLEATGGDAALIRLKDMESGSFSCTAARGFDQGYLDSARVLPKDSTAIDFVFTYGEPIISPDVGTDRRIVHKHQIAAGFVSCAYLPLTVSGAVRGVVHLASYERGFFSVEKETYLTAIARQMSIAIENQELFEQSERRSRELHALYTIADAVRVSLDIPVLAHMVLVRTLKITGLNAGRIYIFNEDDSHLRLTAHQGLPEEGLEAIKAYAPGEGIIGKIFKDNEPCTGIETSCDTGAAPSQDRDETDLLGFKSAIGVPIVIKERPVGVLYLHGKSVGEFTPQNLSLVSAIGRQIGSGIENAWLYEKSQKSVERIRALHDIDLAIANTLDLQTVLNVLLEKIELFLTHKAVSSIQLVDKRTGLLEPVACRNLEESLWKKGLGTRTGISESVLETKLPQIVRNVQTDPRTRESDFYVQHGLVSYIGAPLIVKDQVLGVLGYYTKEEHHFSSQEIEFFVTLAGQAAIAIYNARLYNETERRRLEAEALAQVAHSLTETLDTRAVGERIVTSVQQLLGVKGVTLRLREPNGSFQRVASVGNVFTESTAEDTVPTGMGVTGQAVTLEKAVWSADVQNDAEIPISDRMREYLLRVGPLSMIAIPLYAHEKLIGALTLADQSGRVYLDSEIELLKTFADQAAIAIHNARLYEEVGRSKSELEKTTQYLNRSLNQLGSLYTALTPIAVAASTQELMAGIIDRLVDATGADAALIRIWDKTTNCYPIVSQRNFQGDYLERVGTAPSGTAVAWVVANGQPMIAPDIAAEPRLKGKMQLQSGLRSCAILPLKVQSEVVGVMHIASRKLRYFDEGQRDHLVAIARQMGVALENRQLFNDLKSSRDKLDRANNVKDEFLGVVSHELRTPINVIMGYTTLLKEKAMGELTREQEDVLKKISRVSSDLLSIVDSILYITSLEVNQLAIESEEFSLADLLGEIRADYETRSTQQLSFIWDYVTDLPRIRSDQNKLKRLLHHLLNNAMKFTEQGQITVRAKLVATVTNGTVAATSPTGELGSLSHPKTKRCVEIQIADTGVGIPTEALSEIFNKFYQVDSSQSRRHEGTGLGLYVVKRFTEILGGKVEVTSEIGKGSTFTVIVPADP